MKGKSRYFPFLCTMLLCICVSSASSRPWKPTPNELAVDYSTINHNRGPDTHGDADVIIIMWLVPQRFPEGNPIRQTFEKYVVIGTVHAHITGSTGAVTFEKTDTLQPKDGSGNLLKQMTEDGVPPTLSGAMATMDGILRQSLGAFGKGVTWFIFDAGTVRTCGKGMLIVPYADEDYTYEMPFPGCPQ